MLKLENMTGDLLKEKLVKPEKIQGYKLSQQHHPATLDCWILLS